MSRDVDAGQTVAASLQAPTLFIIARDLERMQIETEVDEAFIGRIREDQPVGFRVFAYPDRVFEGRLAQIRLNPKVESGVVLYNCVIHVDNRDLALKPGMTATVTIEVERRGNILKVPNAALRYVPDPLPEGPNGCAGSFTRGEAILWLPGRDGVQPLKVGTGLAGEKMTEVRGENIEEGMEIALTRDAEVCRSSRQAGTAAGGSSDGERRTPSSAWKASTNTTPWKVSTYTPFGASTSAWAG